MNANYTTNILFKTTTKFGQNLTKTPVPSCTDQSWLAHKNQDIAGVKQEAASHQ